MDTDTRLPLTLKALREAFPEGKVSIVGTGGGCEAIEIMLEEIDDSGFPLKYFLLTDHGDPSVPESDEGASFDVGFYNDSPDGDNDISVFVAEGVGLVEAIEEARKVWES